MKKSRTVLLLIVLIIPILLVACNKKETKPSYTSEIDGMSSSERVSLSEAKSDNALDSDWIPSEYGVFEYLEYIPSGNKKPYFVHYSVFRENTVDCSFPENKFIYEEVVDGKTMYGYMDEEFKILTEPISTEPYIFQFGYARIQEDDESYIVNSNFEVITEYYPGFIYDNDTFIEVTWKYKPETEPNILSGSKLDDYLVPVRIFNDTGTTEGTGSYKVGYAPVKVVVSKEVTANDCTIQPIFDDARMFNSGLAAVCMDGYWGYINEEGLIIIKCQYYEVNDFYDGIAGVKTQFYNSKLWRLINDRGDNISYTYFDYINEFHDGYAWAKPINTSGIKMINTEGEIINDFRVSEGFYGKTGFSNGLYFKGGSEGRFYNEQGELGFNIIFEDALSFSEGLAAAIPEGKNKWGFINDTGEFVIAPKYEYAQSFDHGFALVNLKAYEQGCLIDIAENKYLEELNIYMITKFNEEGYALAYAFQGERGEIDIHFYTDTTMYLGDNAKYYMVKLLNQP